ncbi:MAG TPA: alanine-zipper protein [Streptosporangiaceae bacterium]|nr:alanine-zipper protein [Streptosporangiaceae bacterium]
MTQNKAQKTAARRRMAETGEPYSVARRAAEHEPVADVAAGSPSAGQAAAPRGDAWYASMAEEAGISVAEFRAQEQAANLQDAAGQAQERAERAQERADQAEEAAMMAQEAADLAMEAADMTEEWADEHEQERARRRADQAQEAADKAQAAAELAQEQADEAQEAADEAEEAAEEAQALAEELADGADGEAWTRGGTGWDWLGRDRPGRGWGQDDLQDRVERVMRRFGRVRERADLLISRAERMMDPADDEPGRPGPA